MTQQQRVVTAVLGRKLGMTQVYDASNRIVPVTVVKAGPCVVTQLKTEATDGYDAVQLAFGDIDPRKVNRPAKGHFARAGVPPRRHLVEVRTGDAGDYALGQEVGVDAFAAGMLVDVTGTTKGKGYAGVMKRHGFHGKPASHGVEKVHRSPGSIGACATPARVFKGTKMAGRMGSDRQTTLNLHVHAVDAERGYLLLTGAVPGPTGGTVVVRSAVKAPLAKGGVPKAVKAGA